eukprot:XP_001695752.1 predicted protein [Chlamydomonas reinhardtii]
MAESSDEPCPRCQEPAVVYDSAGGCFVCSSCGYVVAEQGFVAQHAGPTVEQPGDAREGAGGRDRVVSAAAAAYAAAGGGRLDGGSGLGAGSFQDRLLRGAAAAAGAGAGAGAGSRQLRQRKELDTLRALAAALRLPGPVEAAAAGFLAQIHTAQAEAYRAARMRRQLQQQEQWDEAEGKEPQAPCPGADPGAGGVAAAVVGAGGRAAEPVEGEVGDKDNDDDEGAGESESGLDDEEEEDSDDGGGGSGAVADRGRQEGPAAARRRWLAEPPRTGGAMRAARLAGLLYLAARCGGGGDNGGGQVALTLAEVAAACAPGCGGACDMFVLAQYAKHQALFLGLTPLPAVDVERHVGRMTRALLAATAAAAAGGGGGLPPPAAAVPLDETALWRHPLSRRCGQLAALVLLTHLLQLCSGLPLAPGLVTRGNVATQLELLLAAEAALGGAAAVPG